VIAHPSWKLALAVAAVLAATACGSANDGNDAEGKSGTGFNAEEFFAGKTIRVIVTHSAGGGSDLYGRFIADRLNDYIPGKPRVSVTNISGIGGMSEIFNAPADDLVIGVTSQASALYTAVLDPEATFDPGEIRMIGGTGGDPRQVTAFGNAVEGYPSLGDAAGASEPELRFAHTVGAPADLVSDAYFASWLCETLKAPCKMVSVADDDSTDLNLMVQRGEINMQGSSIATPYRDYLPQLEDGSAKVVVLYADDENTKLTPPPGLEPAPDILDVIPPEAEEEYNRIVPIVGGGDIGKHFWAGPALPDDVLEALRSAYADLVKDAKVAEELGVVMSGGDEGATFTYEVSPIEGAEAQKLFEGAASLFAENLDYYKQKQQEYYDKDWS
jgi:hypothetical protein